MSKIIKMGSTKYEIYSRQSIEIAEVFKALAHPARITVLLKLLEQDANMNTLTDLLSEIDLSQPALSRHIEKLKKSGVLTTRIERRGIKCYQVLGINNETMAIIRKIVNKILISNHSSSFNHYKHPSSLGYTTNFLDSIAKS